MRPPRALLRGLGPALVAIVALARGEEEPRPLPRPETKTLLDESDAALEAGAIETALSKAQSSLEAALRGNDLAGQAHARTRTARLLETQGRLEDALATWSSAAADWHRVEDASGEIEASVAVARLRLRESSFDAAQDLDAAIALMTQDTKRRVASATALAQAAGALQRDGFVAQARKLADAAVERLETIAPHSLSLASALGTLGTVVGAGGDYAGARARYERALAIQESQAPGSLDVARSLNDLGGVDWQQGRLDSARRRYEAALAIRETQAPGSLDYASTLNNLGGVLRSSGDLEGARSYSERALAIRQAKAPDSMMVASSLYSLGVVARGQGKLEEARGLLERALAIQERIAPASLDVAWTLNGLGTATQLRGDLAAARDHYQQALRIQESKSPNSLDVATGLNNLGVLASSQGDFDAARDFHERALAIREAKAPDSLDVASSLQNLGIAFRSLGDLIAARGSLQRSLAIREAQSAGSLDHAAILASLGELAEASGDHDGALDYHERALAIREAKAPESLEVAQTLNGIGVVARSRRDFERAREDFARSLAIRQNQAPGSLAEAQSQYNLGTVARSRKDTGEARERFERSWEIFRRQATWVTGDAAMQAFGRSVRGAAAALLRVQLDLGDTEGALATLETSRAQALLQMLSVQGLREHLKDSGPWSDYRVADASFGRAIRRLAITTSALRRAQRDLDEAATRSAPDEVAKKQEAASEAASERGLALASYTSLRLEAEDRLAAVRRSVPALRDDPIDLLAARGGLPPRSLWVEFSVGAEETVVFLVPSDITSPVSAYAIPITETELQFRIAAFVREVTLSSPIPGRTADALEPDPASTGRDLYALLFPAIAARMIAKSERLMIAPDGPLWDLPFAALVTSEGRDVRWLGLEKPLSYQQSLSSFLREREVHSRRGEGCLVVGNPAFGPTNEGSPQRSRFFAEGVSPIALPGTEREARSVGAIYGSPALVGVEATEGAVRERISSARVVHLATHGYFHPTIPMASGVLLAAPTGERAVSDTREDGILQAFEFSEDLPLRADLVVLSACETGRGQRVPGEGVVGLTRSLAMAGARSVIATHWRIDDESSAELMVAFHRKARQGVPKDVALRRAMTEVHRRRSTRNPSYWAAFFLSGEPQ
jgi:CHAT domain-containing protein/tetratricopeptide (TPR) repeat protein